MGPCSARITHVAAYPTRGPSSGKRARISEERLPSWRGRTLKTSMALATLGLVIFLSASICSVVRVTVFLLERRRWKTRRLDGALALLDDDLLELLDHALDLLQVGIDGEGALEVPEGLLRLVELHVDLAISGEHPPVLRVPLDHLVAVLQRLVVFADEKVDGRPLVPALRELGLAPDNLAEGADGGLGLAVVHLLYPDREEPISGGIARAAPDLPDGVLGERAHEVVGIAEEPEDGGEVLRGPDFAHPGGGAPPRLRVGSGELAERLLAGERLAALAGDGGSPGDGEGDGESEEERSHDRRPIMARNCVSSRVGTPRRRASSALEPASSPTTT